MGFHSFRAIIEQEYTIDYRKKKVDLDQPNFLHLIFNDILGEAFMKAVVGIFLLQIIDWIFRIDIANWDVFIFLMVLGAIFNCIYLLFPGNKFLVKLQLWSEEPMYFWMWWRTKKIYFKNRRQIVISTYFYFKYKMLFYGKAKNKIETIRYVKKKSFDRLIIITFTKPTDGMVTVSMRGFFKRIQAFSHKAVDKNILKVFK